MNDLHVIAVAFGFATASDPIPQGGRHDIARSIRSRTQRATRTQHEAASSKAAGSPSERSRNTSPGRRIAPLGQMNDTGGANPPERLALDPAPRP